MPYICGEMGKQIRCTECGKYGNAPALLGVVEKGEGVIVLKCKKCKSTIRIEFDELKIMCRAVP